MARRCGARKQWQAPKRSANARQRNRNMGRAPMVTISNVWDRTTELLGDNLSAVAPVALVGLFVPYAISTAITPLAAGDSGTRIVVNLCALLLGIWIMGGGLAITALALRAPDERGSAVRTALGRLLPMLGIAILLAIAAALLLLPGFVMLGLGGLDFRTGTAQAPNGAWMAFGALYFLLFVIFLCWASGRLLALNATVIAERRGIGAIGRTFALTRGMGGRLFGVMLLYVIVSSVAQLATRTVFGSIFALIFGSDRGISVASVLTAILVAMVGTIFFVLASIFGAQLYLATRGIPAPVDVAPE
jgi:hypothetical protein